MAACICTRCFPLSALLLLLLAAQLECTAINSATKPHAAAHTTPSVVWSVQLTASGNATFGTPTPFTTQQGAGVLIFAVDVLAHKAWVYALDAASGAVLWRFETPFVEAESGWVDVGRAATGDELAFAGVSDGIFALSLTNGSVAWRYHYPRQQVSAHPTYFHFILFFTFENGDQSSPLVALNATTGVEMWRSSDLAFSKIWVLPAQGWVVYMAYNPADVPRATGVSVTARAVNGAIAWQLADLPTTGLNNNPNLDVDAAGSGVYMYSKPAELQRYVTLLNASSGDPIWNISTTGDVADYDTYAYDGKFYRLVSQGTTQFLLESISTEGISLWRTFFASDDMNAILLVGGGAVFAFCPDANAVVAVSAADGELLWTLNALGPTDGQVGGGLLFFGDSSGLFHSVRVFG